MGLRIPINFNNTGTKCKARCRSTFSHIGIQEQCVNRCKVRDSFMKDWANGNINKEEFLCSGNYVDVVEYMLATGIDPCLDDGMSMQDVLKVIDEGQERKEKIKDYQPYLVGGGAIILVLVVFLVFF